MYVLDVRDVENMCKIYAIYAGDGTGSRTLLRAFSLKDRANHFFDECKDHSDKLRKQFFAIRNDMDLSNEESRKREKALIHPLDPDWWEWRGYWIEEIE